MTPSTTNTFQAINPAIGDALPGIFADASATNVADACTKAAEAFQVYRQLSGSAKADLLDQIATEIEAIGDELLQRAHLETALPLPRLTGERGRTCGQLRLFATYLREGSWVDARIDTALPDRQPAPRPSLRQMLRPLGPVAVFGASNFPLAFSVAGGDTASALAAGCPVVVKAHPAHPGTSELVGQAVGRAVSAMGLPSGIFQMVQGRSNAVGMALVQHPAIKAVGFTGSFRGGKALFDAANARPEPIPVYAEMGSINPVFVLPGALAEQGETLARAYVESVALGIGQFCTNPGLLVVEKTEHWPVFRQTVFEAVSAMPVGAMLTPVIAENYALGLSRLQAEGDADLLAESGGDATSFSPGKPTILRAWAEDFIKNPLLAEEVFGPSSVIIEAIDRIKLLEVAESLGGHLTATVHGTADELLQYADLLAILEQKVGRLIINGFPTGVEVSHAMQHGGPYPATTDSRSTSVGTNAIRRFARPVCYQNFPDALLPAELQDQNLLGIWRLMDGELKK
jgi:2,5-dioxopentanoate dehydrogenase